MKGQLTRSIIRDTLISVYNQVRKADQHDRRRTDHPQLALREAELRP
jgi:hypothetical protein